MSSVFRWPRGKYNGRKIVGLELRFCVDLSWFRFVPHFRWRIGEPLLLWLCFSLHAKARYGDAEQPEVSGE